MIYGCEDITQDHFRVQKRFTMGSTSWTLQTSGSSLGLHGMMSVSQHWNLALFLIKYDIQYTSTLQPIWHTVTWPINQPISWLAIRDELQNSQVCLTANSIAFLMPTERCALGFSSDQMGAFETIPRWDFLGVVNLLTKLAGILCKTIAQIF